MFAFVWLEPRSQWVKRGVAENVWLIVDFMHHSYKLSKSMSSDVSGANTVEVKRKSDLDKMVDRLNANAFERAV